MVTITIGSNDLLSPFIKIVADALTAEFGTDPAALLAVDLLGDRSGSSKIRLPLRIKATVEAFITSLGNVTASLNTTLKDNGVLTAACEKFATEIQPAILAQLKEKAPDAEIYWTTLYNPFYGAVLDIKALFPGLEKLNLDQEVLDSLQPIDLSGYGAYYIEKMNEAFTKNTEGYQAVDLYNSFNEVGLTNVNIAREDNGTPDVLADDTLSLNVDPHPNTVGHKLIYDILMPIIESSYHIYDITADATEGGTVTGGGTFDENSTVTLAAVPSEGYVFAGWTENDEFVSEEEIYTFTAEADRTLTAVFVKLVIVHPHPGESSAIFPNSSQPNAENPTDKNDSTEESTAESQPSGTSSVPTEIKADASQSPKTGDSSNLLLWAVLLLIGAMALFTTGMYQKAHK